jgi:hypothetical protein
LSDLLGGLHFLRSVFGRIIPPRNRPGCVAA